MKVNIGKGIELDVDTSRFNAEVMGHALYIGLRNILMDSHASVTRDVAGDGVYDQSMAVAMKKLEAMYGGEIRTTSTREGDPVKAEAVRLATNAIRAAIRKAGKKLSDVDPKAIRERAVGMIERYRAQAEKNVADNRAADVDVTDLV
jgi:ATP-dependent protease Clp ATPase subunit